MTSITGSTHQSDAEIFAAVRRALDNNPAVPATVRVHVEAGTVVLTGSVRTPSERIQAAETVRGVDGVRHIVNSIFVEDVRDDGFGPPDAGTA